MMFRGMILFLLPFCAFVPSVHATSMATAEEVPIIIRQPASEPAYIPNRDTRAVIDAIIDDQTIRANSSTNDWRIGETLSVDSQKSAAGVIGFVEVIGVSNKEDGTYEITCQLLRQSRLHIIQMGDQISHIDLSSSNDKYTGTTDLIIKRSGKDISAKYKPLYTQGLTVGETAETLWENEYLLTYFGQVNYGVKDWLSVSTIVPLDIARAWNATAKARVYQSDSNVFAIGVNAGHIPNEDSTTLNFTVYWDSISSESVISHTLFTIAAVSFESAQDITAVKSLGTSSFQTGYEFILGNWDRVLLGPSYNFETKALGGYLTYLKIWDRFHLSLSLNSTNVSSYKYSLEEGYYIFADMYWRF